MPDTSTTQPAPAVVPYLFFAGRCEEALRFYTRALGAQVVMLMRFSDSPDPAPPGMLPAGFEHKVMHASFTIAGATIYASDGCGPQDGGTHEGYRLALTLPTTSQAQDAFDALARGGNVEMPMSKTFWAPLFGMLTDAFGVRWMVQADAPQQPSR